jgi:hypothetical protein
MCFRYFVLNVRSDFGACYTFNHPKLEKNLKILDIGVSEGEKELFSFDLDKSEHLTMHGSALIAKWYSDHAGCTSLSGQRNCVSTIQA